SRRRRASAAPFAATVSSASAKSAIKAKRTMSGATAAATRTAPWVSSAAMASSTVPKIATTARAVAQGARRAAPFAFVELASSVARLPRHRGGALPSPAARQERARQERQRDRNGSATGTAARQERQRDRNGSSRVLS